MRFNCGRPWGQIMSEAHEANMKRLTNWHPFFVLWPRRIGNYQCVWLERVWRIGRLVEYGYSDVWSWDYRLWEERP